MKTVHQNSPSLGDVLDEIASGNAPPDAVQLREWTTKYPEFKKEIVDFVTDWTEMAAAPAPVELTDEDVNTVVNRTMSRVNQLLFESRKSEKLTDLFVDIKASGHDGDSFRRLLGIDHSILDCLAKRLVSPASVPRRLVEAMASALNREVDVLRQFLLMPPVPATAYKSRKKPQVQQMDFKDLVAHADLTDAEKRRWLVEAVDGDGRE